jgi:putative oxidoreductase
MGEAVLDRTRTAILTFFRIAVGLLFFCHGLASLFGVLGGSFETGGAIPAGEWPGWWAALIQLVGGGLVILGLFTLPAALLCSGSMAYAYFTVHQEKALMPIENGGEAAAMFAIAFLLVALLGAGPVSLDGVLARRGIRLGWATAPDGVTQS